MSGERTWGELKQREDIPDDEPVFLLRAQDVMAPLAVDAWCNSLTVLQRPADVESGKIANAQIVSEAMKAWPNRRLPD